MLQNAPNYTIKKFFQGNMPQNSLANAWLRHALRDATRPAPKIVGPPLSNPAYAYGLLLRNLFEAMRS